MGENLISLNYQLIYRNYERVLDFLLVQMPVRAFCIFPAVFPVAAPDHLAIRVCAVPDLAAKGCAALAADQPVGENALCTGVAAAFAAALELQLNQIVDLAADDCRMTVFHEELWGFAFVDLMRLAQKVHRYRLLQQRVALVFFVGQNGFDRAVLPIRSAGGRGNALFRQRGRDARRGLSVQKHPIDLPHDSGLCLINDRSTVRSTLVAEEVPVGHRNLAVRDALAPAPGDVFGDAAALLLRKTRHDRDHQFALAVQRVDVFLLKRHSDALFLEPAYGGQAVHSVSGEAADGLGDDSVDLPVQRIRDQAVEPFASGSGGRGNAVVGVQPRVFPCGVAADEPAVIITLYLERGFLFLLIRADARVSRYSGMIRLKHMLGGVARTRAGIAVTLRPSGITRTAS